MSRKAVIPPGRTEFRAAGATLFGQRRFEEAASLYRRADMYFEAGISYLHAADKVRALDSFVRVEASNPNYRAACAQAVALACEMDVLSIALDHFLAPFVESGPHGAEELETFYLMGRHYRKHGFVEHGREALLKLLGASPGYRDAEAVVSEIEAAERATRAGARRILEDEASFRGDRDKRRGRRPAERAPEGPSAIPTVSQKVTPPPVPTPEPSAVYPFAVGSVVADRYRLTRQIGRGGMSVVYQATDQELGEEIALKAFVEETQAEELQSRFKREMQLSRRLYHPNILRLFDLGFYHGHRYITMELLRGGDLRLRMSSPVPIGVALDYLIQACAGLQAAHDMGTIHRDIKPENLFITTDEVVKIMDFGIAKVQSSSNVTLSGMIWGTPKYIAPEQIDNFSSVTSAADLYSLGVVAYELMTGQVPFDHPELTYLLAMQLKQPPVPPREMNPRVPPDVEEVILVLLEKDPTRRFASCRELEGRLQSIRRRFPPGT